MQPKPTTLPARVDSSMLAKYLQAGEPVIVAKLVGVGNTAAYDFRDRASRVYVFRWESQQGGHVLRVPLSLWNADKGRIAHDIMDQRGMLRPIVVTVEGVIDASDPLRMAQTIYDTFKSQAGQEAKSSGSYPENAGSTPAPATTLEQPTTPVLNPPEMDATAAVNAPLVVGQGEEAPVASASASSAPDAPLVASSQIMHKDQPLFSAAWDKLESPMRIKALAALLDTDEETLKTAIQDPLSTVELGHAGWVKRREPQA